MSVGLAYVCVLCMFFCTRHLAVEVVELDLLLKNTLSHRQCVRQWPNATPTKSHRFDTQKIPAPFFGWERSKQRCVLCVCCLEITGASNMYSINLLRFDLILRNFLIQPYCIISNRMRWNGSTIFYIEFYAMCMHRMIAFTRKRTV